MTPDNPPPSSPDSNPLGTGVGGRIRARRKQLDWSLQELADKVGCAKGYLSEVETGRRPPPGDEILARLEAFMMMKPGELIELARWERTRRAGGATLERTLARAQTQSLAARRLAELLRAKTEPGKSSLDRAFESGELRRLIEQLSPMDPPPGDTRDAKGTGGPQEGDTRPGGERAGASGAGAEDDGEAGGACGVRSSREGAASPRFGMEPLARALPVEVPLINKVAAGYPREFTDLGYPARVADEYVRCPDVHDPDAFAARVVGDSMSPEYREGDVIVFSPAREVKGGSDCFVRLERDAETTFKRVYFETGPAGEELIRLQPINNAHAPRVLPREDVAGLYAAVKAIREVRFEGGGRG